ncbi:MAG: tyrosine-protein phosphatase [Solirubrobacteraceae bacterium]
MIDLHAHILPGLDDGPESMDAAVAMARVAVAGGTRAMATTSHVNRGFGLQAADLEAAREALVARLAEEEVELELLPGGEVSPGRLPDLDDAALRAFALGGGRCVLLECPFSPVDSRMEAMVADLRERGFDVLLAHPERSPTFQKDPSRLARLVEGGALAQVTTGSFAGLFGETARRAATAMLRHGIVHVLASDAHDAVYRGPDLRATADALDDDQRRWMAGAAPAAILAGDSLPERPPLAPDRGVLARLRSWSAR